MRRSNRNFNMPPPPPGKPLLFELLKIGWFKFPSSWAKMVFKYPTLSSDFVYQMPLLIKEQSSSVPVVSNKACVHSRYTETSIAKRASDVIKFRPPARLRQTNRTMAKDFDLSSVSSSAKTIILTQNDGIPGCKFEGEPVHYTVEQLKRWLKCRGIKTDREKEILARTFELLS